MRIDYSPVRDFVLLRLKGNEMVMINDEDNDNTKVTQNGMCYEIKNIKWMKVSFPEKENEITVQIFKDNKLRFKNTFIMKCDVFDTWQDIIYPLGEYGVKCLILREVNDSQSIEKSYLLKKGKKKKQ